MQYLQSIIWTMFFVVMVEMLFPSSDIKKYLKLVLGFIVIYIILSPIVQAVTATNLAPKNNIWQYINYYQTELGEEVVYSHYEEEVKKQQEGMLEIYNTQIEEQTKKLIEKHVAVGVLGVEAETFLEEAQFKIDSIAIEVVYVNDPKESFGIAIGSKDESIVLNTGELEKQIKKCLNDFYNWDNTNIYITVQEN